MGINLEDLMSHLKLFSSCSDDITGFTIYSTTIVTLNNDSSKTILFAFLTDICMLQNGKKNLLVIIIFSFFLFVFFFPPT